LASVQLWGSQLAANDFPPICALTGRPAETWRKFKFATPPAWTYALIVLACVGLLGILIFAIVVNVVSLRATGYLPLTKASRRTVDLASWVPAGAILVSIGLMTAVVIAAFANVGAGNDAASTAGALIFFGSLFLLVLGLIARLFLAPFVMIRARVQQVPGQFEPLIELRNVSPAFANAVRQRQQARAALTAGSQSAQGPPASESK
jgi:hypothetical protein